MNTVVRELSVVELEQVTGGGLWDDLCTMGSYIIDDPLGAAGAAWDGATSVFDGFSWSDAGKDAAIGAGFMSGFSSFTDSNLNSLPSMLEYPEGGFISGAGSTATEWGAVGAFFGFMGYTLGTAWGNVMYGEYGLLNC